MAARATSSGTISFGLVSIPVKVFTATSPQKVRFNMLEPGTNTRVKQQYVSTVSGEVVERSSMVKGYEYSRGQFVTFTAEELKALEAARTSHIEIVEFVPLSSIELVQIEKSYYLGPDRGGDKAYQLLAAAMLRQERVAVGRWSTKGKEQLVLLRPYKDGLLLHQLFYATEVRAFDDVDRGASFDLKEAELDLADKLIDQLSSDSFDASKYRDSYTERVQSLVEQKISGQEISIAPEAPKAQIIDLFEALKQSLDSGPAKASTRPAAAKSDKPADSKPKPVKKATPRKRASRAKKKKTG